MGKTLLKVLHGIVPSWLYKAKLSKRQSPSSKLLPFFRSGNSKASSSELSSTSIPSLINAGDVQPLFDEIMQRHNNLPITANASTTSRTEVELDCRSCRHPNEKIHGQGDDLREQSHHHGSLRMLLEDSIRSQSQDCCSSFNLVGEMHSYCAEHKNDETQVGFQSSQTDICHRQYKDQGIPVTSEYCQDSNDGVVVGLKRKVRCLQSNTDKEDEKEGEGDSKTWSGKRRKGQDGLMSCDLPESIRNIVGNGRAVVKQSSNPQLAVWESMVEMIVGNGLWDMGSLEFLLFCYLSLNEPHVHSIIQSSFLQVLKDLQRIP